MNTMYNLLRLNKNISLSVFNTLKTLKGLNCTIRKPVEKSSIFGLEDLVEYDEKIYTEEKLLLFGLFQEASQGMQDFDTFIEAYALTTYKERLPLQTLITVNFCNREMSFKVDDHKNLFPSVCEQLFIKNILVPAT